MFFDAEVLNCQLKMEGNGWEGQWAWTKASHRCSSHMLARAASSRRRCSSSPVCALWSDFHASHESDLRDAGKSEFKVSCITKRNQSVAEPFISVFFPEQCTGARVCVLKGDSYSAGWTPLATLMEWSSQTAALRKAARLPAEKRAGKWGRWWKDHWESVPSLQTDHKHRFGFTQTSGSHPFPSYPVRKEEGFLFLKGVRTGTQQYR